MIDMKKFELSGGATDTLYALFYHGCLPDGDMPSKSGRDELVDQDLAFRDSGWNGLTIHGLRAAQAHGWTDWKEIGKYPPAPGRPARPMRTKK